MFQTEKLTGILRLKRIFYYFPSSHYILLSIFFFAGLELIAALQRWILLLVAIMLTILITGIAFIRTEEDRQGKFHLIQTILPALAAFGVTGFSLFLESSIVLHVYFALSSLLFFYLLKHGAKQAYPTWNIAISLVILFVCVASILGWRFHLYVPIVIIIPVIFCIILLTVLQSMWRFADHISEAWLISLSIAFVLSEFVWVLQFLPLHFIVQAGVIVALYYIIFQLTSLSYERSLTKKDILEYSLMTIGALIVLLATAQWV